MSEPIYLITGVTGARGGAAARELRKQDRRVRGLVHENDAGAEALGMLGVPVNAGPPCAALAMHFAPRTPTRGRATGGAEAGILRARRGAIGAATIRPHTHKSSSVSAAC